MKENIFFCSVCGKKEKIKSTIEINCDNAAFESNPSGEGLLTCDERKNNET